MVIMLTNPSCDAYDLDGHVTLTSAALGKRPKTAWPQALGETRRIGCCRSLRERALAIRLDSVKLTAFVLRGEMCSLLAGMVVLWRKHNY
jgi:hypothetical protein